MSEKLNLEMQRDPALQSRAQKFAKRLEAILKDGVPGVGTAPYFIVIAERKGFPPVEQQSLAHYLQKMWLKATVLDLGFHLVSATAEMAKARDFCNLVGLPFGVRNQWMCCRISVEKSAFRSTPRCRRGYELARLIMNSTTQNS